MAMVRTVCGYQFTRSTLVRVLKDYTRDYFREFWIANIMLQYCSKCGCHESYLSVIQTSDFTFYHLVTEPVNACAILTPERTYIHSCSRFGALNLSYTLPYMYLSYQVLIFTWAKHLRVKCLAKGPSIISMSEEWEGRNMIFLWKSCTKRDSKPHSRQRHRQGVVVEYCLTTLFGTNSNLSDIIIREKQYSPLMKLMLIWGWGDRVLWVIVSFFSSPAT